MVSGLQRRDLMANSTDAGNDSQPSAPPAAPPDFRTGVSLTALPDGGSLLGRVGDDEVLLVRRGDDLFAVGAHCTHYHGPLAEGLIVDDTVRCPWHHACFNLRTGEALRAPALDAIACWRVERSGDTVMVREKLSPAAEHPAPQVSLRSESVVPDSVVPDSVVIVGGGGAGLAAADMLRRQGYDGPITMISADEAPPSDRPNLSKDYLAGTAQDDWIPLRGPEFYADQRIELLLGTRVTAIDVKARQVRFGTGTGRDATRSFGALLLATGADPVRLTIPGADSPHVRYLRTFADSRAIIDEARTAKRVVVIGTSFIGLEVSASLRARDIQVDVVAPDQIPLERIMGPEIGRAVQRLHESHGVTFHLGQTAARIEGRTVTLSGGGTLEADLVVAGIGVRPAITLAEQAGLTVDRGVVVNEYLETSGPGIFAAGDIARWPDPHTGDRIRVEHWVVALRQGQTAARNILGQRVPHDFVPFFWSQHYDVTINYVGHAERWDTVQIDGIPDAHDCTVTYTRDSRRLAVATIARDKQSLQAELDLEHDTNLALRRAEAQRADRPFPSTRPIGAR
jgi:NADPH-dependent 2,4-dienoyl-CoA reductase/sulfur reductase-like enzyme/nitrite reductase/ring-hydroxylating ferredoxin subunit